MPASRFVSLVASGLALTVLAPAALPAADTPQFSKPKPVDTPPSVAPLPPATFDNSLAISGDELKARENDTRLSVGVQVNGRGPYQFVVDSGADTSAVGQRMARALDLPLGQPVILDGTTARDMVDSVKVGQLTVGTSRFDDLELPALREGDMGGDGMLGIDALAQQRVMMDFENKRIRVEDARIPEKHYPDEILVIARRQRGQLILTHVTAAGLPLDAVIDTGSEVTVGNIALRDKVMHWNPDKVVTVQAVGVTGQTMELQMARIPELRLGSVVLRDVPIAFADLTPFKVFGISNEPALLLGTDILEKFQRVSLDFRSRKVRFQLRKCQSLVSIGSMAGVSTQLYSVGDNEVCAS